MCAVSGILLDESCFSACLCSSKDLCWPWLSSPWSWRPPVLTGWLSPLTFLRRRRYQSGCDEFKLAPFFIEGLLPNCSKDAQSFLFFVCQINSSELIWSRELVARSLSAWRAPVPPNTVYIYQRLQQNPKLPSQTPGVFECVYSCGRLHIWSLLVLAVDAWISRGISFAFSISYFSRSPVQPHRFASGAPPSCQFCCPAPDTYCWKRGKSPTPELSLHLH